MVFVNANFSHLWNEVEKKIIIEHEIGHCVGYHVEVKSLLNSLKYALMLQIVALFIPLWLGLTITVCLFIVDQATKKMFMPVFYSYEFKADIYAAIKTKFSASIVDFYNKLALNRSSSTHPTVADRQKNMTNFKLK